MELPANVESPGWISSLDRLGPLLYRAGTHQRCPQQPQERISVVLSNRDLSPMLLASELRRVFDELQPVLTDAGFLPAFAASRNDTGVAFTDALLEDVGSVYAQL
jgi:hypothetical protein